MIEIQHPLSRSRRCKLLDVPRSSSYYHPKPVSERDEALMKTIDRIFIPTSHFLAHVESSMPWPMKDTRSIANTCAG